MNGPLSGVATDSQIGVFPTQMEAAKEVRSGVKHNNNKLVGLTLTKLTLIQCAASPW